MSLWAEDVTESQFRVCLREMISFSGTHENVYLVRIVATIFVQYSWPRTCRMVTLQHRDKIRTFYGSVYYCNINYACNNYMIF